MPQDKPRVPKRIAAVIINSLKGGVVPRVGLPYITVGREARDRGPSARPRRLWRRAARRFRFLVGRYGAGKSFLLQTIRNHAMGTRLRRGRRRPLARAPPSGQPRPGPCHLQGAHPQPVHQDPSRGRRPARSSSTAGLRSDLLGGRQRVARRPRLPRPSTSCARHPSELVHGFDFCRVLDAVLPPPTSRATRSTKAQVRQVVPRRVRAPRPRPRPSWASTSVIGDDDWYEYLKLFAEFLVGAGYAGLIVLVDELVNLYKIPNADHAPVQLREDPHHVQRHAPGQGTATWASSWAARPQSIEDTRRGVYSYEALRSRLAQGRFAGEGMTDMLAPVIHLKPLTHEELLVLTEKLAAIHAGLLRLRAPPRRPHDLADFLKIEFGRVGGQTPTSHRARSSATSSSCWTSSIRTPVPTCRSCWVRRLRRLRRALRRYAGSAGEAADVTRRQTSSSSPLGAGHERLRPLRALHPGLHLPTRLGEPARHPGRRRRGHLQHRGQRAAYRLHRLRQDRGGVLPHTHPVLDENPPRERGRALHRPR